MRSENGNATETDQRSERVSLESTLGVTLNRETFFRFMEAGHKICQSTRIVNRKKRKIRNVVQCPNLEVGGNLFPSAPLSGSLAMAGTKFGDPCS